MKKAGDFMNKRVVYFSSKNTILEISMKFAEYKISGAPIVDSGKLVGIITNSDIVRFINGKVYKDVTEVNASTSTLIVNLSTDGKINLKKEVKDALDTKVGDIMTKDVKSVTVQTTLQEVVAIMVDNGINRLPVVDKGALVGIIARNDLIKAFR